MGIDVCLEDERGKKIVELPDPKGVIMKLISKNINRFFLLKYVDLYGNTVFNRLQMEQLINELLQLKKEIQNEEEINYIIELERLAKQCLNEPHLYLKFYGD